MPVRKNTEKLPTGNKKQKTTTKDDNTTSTTNLTTELSEINKELDNLNKDLKTLLNILKSKNNNTSNRTRKTKDPNAPKRSRSAYIIFCNENRSSVQNNNPELGAKDVTKTLAKMWKSLPDKKKVTYNKKAAADKVRYEKEMASYKNS